MWVNLYSCPGGGYKGARFLTIHWVHLLVYWPVPEISESGKHWFSAGAEAEAGRAACWANWMHLTSPELLERQLTWVSLKHWATEHVCSFLCHSKKDLQQIIKQNTVESETQHDQLLEGAESWMFPGEPWFVKRDSHSPSRKHLLGRALFLHCFLAYWGHQHPPFKHITKSRVPCTHHT